MASRNSVTSMSDFSREVAAMKKQIAHLAASIEDTAKEGGVTASSIADNGRRLLSQATALVDDLAHKARDTVSDTAHVAYDRAKTAAHNGEEMLEETIRERPLTSIAVALGVGALLALMLRRR
jgi:ElaB/YqjD/DUF883 family membrane-anchored ribosome-binding protein